jgi:hypothetical protein
MGRPTGHSVGSTSIHSRPTAAVETKKADAVPVAMEPMAVSYAAHADHAAPVSDVTSPESEGANVTSAETTTTKAATHTAAEAATAMTTPCQHQQTTLCSQICVAGIDRLREGCRGREQAQERQRY